MPKQIWNLVVDKFTTTLTINTGSTMFYDFMQFIHIKYPKSKFRSFKITTKSQYGNNEDNICVGLGYGTHFIKYRNKFLRITLSKEESAATDAFKETIHITKFGRNKNLFDQLLKDIGLFDESHNLKLFDYEFNEWRLAEANCPKRTFDTIFIEQEKKDLIINSIQNFLDNENWFLEHGIPYHYAIILYGPPGSGKSSVIKAIASHFDFKIGNLPVERLHRLSNAAYIAPKNTLIVIEDIDCSEMTHERGNISTQKDDNKGLLLPSHLSTIMNAMDGLFSRHGQILIATTNHIEKLDNALIRPGRFNRKIEIGYMTNETINAFTNKFYNKEIDPALKVNDKILGASLQEKLLQNNSYEEIIEFITKGN